MPFGLTSEMIYQMISDIELSYRFQGTEVSFSGAIFIQALIDIENRVISIGGSTLSSYGLPESNRTDSNKRPTDIIQETSYDINPLTNYINENEPKLLPE